MTTRHAVDEFLSSQPIAVVGVSASGERFGATAYRELKKQGYQLLPVHPTAETIDGDTAYPSIGALPSGVEGVLLVVPPPQAELLIPQIADAGIDRVWMQQGSESEEAVRAAEELGLTTVAGECVLMWSPHTGFPHTIHRWIWELIGKAPK